MCMVYYAVFESCKTIVMTQYPIFCHYIMNLWMSWVDTLQFFVITDDHVEVFLKSSFIIVSRMLVIKMLVDKFNIFC